MWCIPPEQNAEFVARMEDILDVYALSYDENCPVICIDEKPYQLLSAHLLRKCALWAAIFLPLRDERREPIAMAAGSPKKYDNEYEWHGDMLNIRYG